MRRHPNVELMYIFGSAAKKRAKPKDTDIAVLLKKPCTGMAGLNYRMKLTDDLETIFTKPVDLVILNTAASFLRFQVTKYGSLLFERTARLNAHFRYRAISDYLNTKSLYDFFTQQTYKRHGVSYGRSRTHTS